MPSIDERVVAMAFENQVFETRVSQTISTLGKLDTALKNISGAKGLEDIEKAGNKVTLNGPMSALDKLRAKLGRSGDGAAQGFSDIERASSKVTLDGTGKAIDKTQAKLDHLGAGSTFNDIEKAADQVTLNGISKAVEAASHQFTVLQGAAAVALGGIASQAASKSFSFAKGFGVGPIIDGLHEYETNLKSIQTVQANTDRPLTEINKSLQELNAYSDQTIYNFSEMARNIGTFTAAGVDLKTATSSIKGIANMAALSGSSSQQAATAMYQLSQAISSGRVGLQDWNSVVNAGMGGKKLQNALAQTSIAMGEMKDSSVKLEGPMKKLTINGESFRESIMAKPGSKPWLTSEILVNTLATLDGRFSKAALSAELTKDGLKKYTAAQVEAKIADNRAALEKKNGVKYSDAQFAALMKLSDSAFKSATEVKTLGQVFDVAKETIGSGWSASFQNIFGNLTEAKKLFTGMSGTINGFINANALARNELLAGWKDLGGREAAIQGIKNIFNVLFDVLGKVGQAFREIFPRKTSEDLADMSKRFLIFTAHLNNSPAIIDNIARTFKGFFAVLHIGWSIIKGVVGVITDLLGVVGKGSGGFLNFTGGVGDFLVAIDAALTKGGLLTGFFKGLTAVLKVPVGLIKTLVGALAGLFGGADAGNLSNRVGEIERFGEALTPLEKLVIRVKNAWEKLSEVFGQFKEMIEPWFSQMVDKFRGFGDILGEAFKSMDFDKIMSVVQTGLVAGLLVTLKKALGDKGVIGSLTGTFDSITKVMGGVTGQLEAMQKKVQAQTILTIAAAILALAGGVYILSTINAEDLAKAMTAVAVGLGQLMGAMKLMMGGMGKLGMLQLPIIAGSMVVLAASITILAGAVKIFSTMSWEDIAKGLTGVAGSLAAIAIGMKLLGPGTLIQAGPLLAIAIALNLLGIAVKQFGEMSWTDLAKGLLGVGGALAVIGAAMLFFGPSTLLVGPGLVAVAFGMTVLAGAVAAFGNMDLKVMAQGIAGVALALVAIAASLFLIPPTAALQGAGILIVATALVALGGALAIIGGLKVATLVKGILGMGAALLVLGIGLIFMGGTLPGSLALLAAAAAFAILGPAMALIGNLAWGTILKALAAMALTLGVLAVVGALAAGPLISLGAALIVLGVGLLAVTAPIYVFAKAISLLSDVGQKGVAVFLVALTGFIAILPKIVIDFVKGLVEILNSIVELAPKLLAAVGKLLDQVIQFVIAKAPALAVAVGTLIGSFLTVVDSKAPSIIQSGIKLLTTFLNGVAQNIGQIVTTVGTIITGFLNGLTTQAPRITASGLKLILTFLSGITSGIPKIVNKVADMVAMFLSAVTVRIPGLVAKGAEMIVAFINGVSSKIGAVIGAGVHLIGRFLDGIADAIPDIKNKALHLARVFLNNLADGLAGLGNIGFKALIRFLNGLEAAIRENSDDLINAGIGVGDAIMDGVAQAFNKGGGLVRKALEQVFKLLPGWAKRVLGIHSPSTVFAEIGRFMMAGFVVGIEQGAPGVAQSMATATKGAVATAKAALAQVPNLVGDLVDMSPVISPVLDLTNVEKNAQKLGELTNVVPITAAVSFGQAATISADQVVAADQAVSAAPSEVKFEFNQTNTSPESLSDIEIYRQTNNLLSQTKTAIGAL